jgi:hypothetical protein
MKRPSAAGLWGILGVLALLGQAMYRLTPLALDLVDHALEPLQIAVLVAWCAFMIYSEGYRGFQQKFSPRVVARAQHLSEHPRPLFVVLAPLYVIGLVHATRKRLISSWAVSLAIIGLVLIVRQLDQPWRGIIDAGVVLGLAWGAVAIVYFVARAFGGHAMPVPSDVP